MHGMIDLFGLDAMANMASAAGLHIGLRVPEAPDARSRFRHVNRVNHFTGIKSNVAPYWRGPVISFLFQ